MDSSKANNRRHYTLAPGQQTASTGRRLLLRCVKQTSPGLQSLTEASLQLQLQSLSRSQEIKAAEGLPPAQLSLLSAEPLLAARGDSAVSKRL